MTTNDLSGKTAILTGASSGIGLALAEALIAEGCNIVAVARSAERLAELEARAPEQVLAFPADVGTPESAEAAVQAAIDRFGRLDIVMPNAGIYLGGDLVDTDPTAIAQLIDTNVTGVMTLMRAALPRLIAQGSGDIIVTSSVSGHQDIHWEPVYSASKHAVLSFVHTVRQQTAESGVRIGAIAPGIVLNPLWGFTHGSPEEAREIEARSGIRSSDVAEAVVFMLTRPPHVAIRDLVILPTGQPI